MKTFRVTLDRARWETACILVTAKDEDAAYDEALERVDDPVIEWACSDQPEEANVLEIEPVGAS